MNSSATRIIFFVLCVFYISSVSCKIHLTQGMHLHIMNGLPNNDHPLQFRCHSGNDDKELQTLVVGEEIHWKFYNNLFGKTLWFCHFYWGDKNRSFEVYNDAKSYPLCKRGVDKKHKTHHCHWLVKEDGFYSSINEQDPKAKDKQHEGVRLAGWAADDGPIRD